MESQTRFNLNTAIENWRAELGTQSGLTPDVRRELETHLRDTITGFQQRGLNDEESFWLAKRRIGQPEQLVTEFAKADPAMVWRERAFWLMLGLLVIRMANMLMNSFISPLYIVNSQTHTLGNALPQWVSFYLPNWLNQFHFLMLLQFLPAISEIVIIVGLLVLMKRCQTGKMQTHLTAAMTSRSRFFTSCLAFAIFVAISSGYIWHVIGEMSLVQAVSVRLVSWLMYTVPLIGFATWLLPVKNKKVA